LIQIDSGIHWQVPWPDESPDGGSAIVGEVDIFDNTWIFDSDFDYLRC
jgi:hypothetical protein